MYYDIINTLPALRVLRLNRVTGCIHAANDQSCSAKESYQASSGSWLESLCGDGQDVTLLGIKAYEYVHGIYYADSSYILRLFESTSLETTGHNLMLLTRHRCTICSRVRATFFRLGFVSMRNSFLPASVIDSESVNCFKVCFDRCNTKGIFAGYRKKPLVTSEELERPIYRQIVYIWIWWWWWVAIR